MSGILRPIALALLLVLSGAASAATDMLTASGATTAPTSSTCPTYSSGSCSSGWFRLEGLKNVVLQVWETTGTHTSTVVLYQRLDSTAATTTLKTWTNPTDSEVAVAIDPAAGEIKLTVSAVQAGGTVKAKLEAVTQSGTKVW